MARSLMNKLLYLLALSCILIASVAKTTEASTTKKADPNDNKGNTPFFLQDPRDKTCLGPNGFTVCDERSLWILTRRADRKKTYSLVSLLNPSPYGMCLERKRWFFGILGAREVGMGLCNKGGSKNWEFEFVDKNHIRLSTKGMCLVRGKLNYKNSISVQNCKKGEYLPLIYQPSTVHQAGFYLQAADGACFDGSKFRSCDGQGSDKLLWGVGIKYIWGKAHRYFFNFVERALCIVQKGGKTEKDSCTNSGAYRWGLADGKLSVGNGKLCVSRLADDSAVLARCNEANEYVSMNVPTVYTSEDLAEMIKNQDNLSAEEKATLAQLIKQHQKNSS